MDSLSPWWKYRRIIHYAKISGRFLNAAATPPPSGRLISAKIPRPETPTHTPDWRSPVDGYLFFDAVTPETRSALFELVEDELLRLAAVTVSGTVAAFAAYSAPDIRAAYAIVEAVAESVGRPAARLLAVTDPDADNPTAAPGTASFEGERAIALALLQVPLSRAEEVAALAGRIGDARAAVVLGGAVTVLVEVDGTSLDELEPRLADVLAVAGEAITDVLVTTTELGVGWGGSDEDD